MRIDLTSALALLAHQPGLGEKVQAGRPIQVRHYLMRKSQRWIYSRVKDAVLEVLSVWGAEREFGTKL